MTAESLPDASFAASNSTPGELLDLFERLTEIIRTGDRRGVEDLLQEHPEHEVRLRAVLPALGVMTSLKEENGRSSGPPGCVELPEGLSALSSAGRPKPTRRDESVLGDFRLLREIGRGGMGIVYEAEQLSLRRRVAVKVLPLAGVLDNRALARFKNEATAAATLYHAHIVPVFFVGSERSVHFYAMQLIEGQSLAEVIVALRASVESRPLSGAKKSSPATDHEQQATDDSSQSEIRNLKSEIDTAPLAALSTDYSHSPKRYFRRVAEIGIQIAQALEHAHEHGILHRDVKPANILIDGHGKAWITDFGLARLEADASKTFTGDLVGTLRYMSPEQALAKRVAVDQRTDVYSLAATLYELLTLVPVYQETDRQALMRQIAFEEPRPPRKRNPAIPQELDTIVIKGLEKNPDHRYESAQRLADDLQRYLDHQPLLARRPTLVDWTRKWARRHPSQLLAATVALAVCLVAAVAAYSVSSQQRKRTAGALAEKTAALAEVEKERDRAREARGRAEDERERAVESLRVARDIVDGLYMQVGTQWIADESAPSGFQQGILTAAVKFYERLAETQITRPGNLSELSLVSSGYGRIGVIQHYLQNYEEAVEARRKTVETVREALEYAPRHPGVRSAVSEVNYELGQSLVELARFEEALAAFNESASAAAELVHEEVEPVKHRYWVARADLARASVLARTGAYADATALADSAKEKLQAVLREADKEQVYWNELFLDARWHADYWLAKSLAHEGDLAEAVKRCESALRSCRVRRSYDHEDARLRDLEIDLLELSAEIASLSGDLSTAADEYHRVLKMRQESFRSRLPPERLMLEVFNQTMVLDGLLEPGPFCGHVETQLRLARVFRKTARPYATENVLGECTLVMEILVGERPNALRYRIAQANVYALAAELLADRRPDEAEIFYRRARQIWAQASEQFPRAKDFVSGVHGLQPDWDHFETVARHFPDLSATETEEEEVNPYQTAFNNHTNGRSWMGIEAWKAAIEEFEKSAAKRTAGHVYDWLQLAIAHARLEQHDEAEKWFEKADESIAHSTDPDAELIELRDEARTIVNQARTHEEGN